MFTTKDGAKPTVIGKNGAQNMLEKNTIKAFGEFFEVATRGIGNANPFEVSSTTRSINANLHTYRGNVDALTNSNHLRGIAVDVSTSISNCPEGDQLYTWCESNTKDLKRMGIYVYRHALKSGKDHLHIEYVGPNSSRAGIVKTEEVAEEED